MQPFTQKRGADFLEPSCMTAMTVMARFAPCSTLTRHLLFELCNTFLASLAAFVLLFIFELLIETSRHHNLGLDVSLRLVPFILPRALSHAISAAWLLAVCRVYGSMAASNEFHAVKAMGISPLQVFAPALVIGALLAVPSLWFSDVGSSWGLSGQQERIVESASDVAYGMLRSEKAYGTKDVSLAVKQVEGRSLIKPIVLYSPRDEEPVVAVAEVGELDTDLPRKEIRFRLTNGTITDGAGCKLLRFPDSIVLRLSICSLSGIKCREYLTLRQLPAAIANQREKIRQTEAALARQEDGQANEGQPTAEAEELRRQLAGQRRQLSRWMRDGQRRYSHAFCCLSFTVLGLPLSVLLRGKDTPTIFFFAFLPILAFFYPFDIFCSKSNDLPPCSFWLSHAVLVIAGVVLFRRVWKH